MQEVFNVKVITLRLSDEEYKLITEKAKAEYRPISNFITAKVLTAIQEDNFKVEEDSVSFGKDIIKNIEGGRYIYKKGIGIIRIPDKRASVKGLLGKAKGIIPKGRSSSEFIRELRASSYGKFK
jgi:hypothetical protein